MKKVKNGNHLINMVGDDNKINKTNYEIPENTTKDFIQNKSVEKDNPDEMYMYFLN
jgi:hypothetical protein